MSTNTFMTNLGNGSFTKDPASGYAGRPSVGGDALERALGKRALGDPGALLVTPSYCRHEGVFGCDRGEGYGHGLCFAVCDFGLREES